MTATVKLSTPITGHSGTFASLTLKVPTARSFIAHGSPFTVKTGAEGNYIEYSDKAMLKFLADSTGVDEITLEDLAAPDYFAARDRLAGLILMATGTAEKDPS